MSQFWSNRTHQLSPYTPGEQPQDKQYIKLNTNENPYGPSPKALEAMKAECDNNMRLYPDPEGAKLKQGIADYYSLNYDQVFVGNSSDEVLAHIFAGLLKHDKPLLYPDISYSFYPVYAKLYDIETVSVPLSDDFTINIDDYQQDCGAIIFANPNAPTGLSLSVEKIAQLAESQPNSAIVIDEAYVDFGGESAVSLINQYKNILVTQTFSKSRSLAGLRVGYAMGSAKLIEGLERVKNSFNSYPLDRIALAGATASITDKTYFETMTNKIINTRENTTTALSNLGFDVIPSSANFIFAKPPEENAEALYLSLKEKSILVRYFNKPRISNYLRITIGTDEEMEQLMSTLKTIL